MVTFKPPETVNDWTQVLVNCVVAISAALALYQYYQARADTRIERTLQFMQRFESTDLAPTRNGIINLATKSRHALQKASDSHSFEGLGSAERSDLRRRLVLSVIYGNRGDLPAEINEVAGYFSTLQSCIDQFVCDVHTAHGFLGAYALSFWHDFAEVIAYERSHSRKQFATGMEKFVDWERENS